MKSKISKASIIPFFAGVLILLHYILVSSVTPPTNNGLGIRYLFYWLLVIISSIGTNLLALYLGYTAMNDKYPWRKLVKIALYLGLTVATSVIIGIVFFHRFSAKDLWLMFVPISHADFPFAASMLIWYSLGPILAQGLAHISQAARHTLAFLLTWFTLIIPFIFAKSVWGISDANNIVWVGVLYVFGILIANGEYKWITRRRAVSTIVIGLGVAAIILRFSSITATPNLLSGRFFSIHSLNVALISFAIFGVLIQISRISFFNLNKAHWPNWFAMIAYFVSCLPIVTSFLNESFFIKENLSSLEWLLLIVIYLVVFIVLVTCLTAIFAIISRFKIFKRLIDDFPIKNFSDFTQLPQLFQKKIRDNWRILLVICNGVLFTFVQMFISSLATTSFSIEIVKNIFKTSSGPILLSTIIFTCFFWLLYSLINRFWPALLFTIGVSIFITVAEFLKISLRDEPILPADLSMITALSEIAKMISPVIIVAASLLIIILVTASLILQKHLGGMYPQYAWKKRGLIIVLMLIFFTGGFWVNHENSLPYIVFKAFNVSSWFYDQTTGAKMNGPILQFINNLDVKIMDRPAGYSRVKIQSIMAKYDCQAKVINRKRTNSLSNQTIIFVLSESFSNPNRIPEMKVTPNPIPYLSNLEKTTDSGLMLSSGYGGGTANMEWQALTGLSISNLSPTLPTPYTQLVHQQKTAPAFTNLFDSKIAIHPFNASLYNRKQVFKKFGFNRFYYEGSKYKISYKKRLGTSPYVSDDSAYKQTMKIVNQAQSGSQFIQLSTMQNHMPYTNYYKNGKKFKITGSAFDSANASSVQTYTQGIYYTDRALKEFILELDKLDRPVTVVWYGDHLASLYKSNLMNKYPIQLHETDYFIYNNKNHKLSYTNRLVSPYSFSALALDNANSKITPYYALITKVTEDLPAMTTNPSTSQINAVNGGNVFVGQNSKLIKYKALTKKQKVLYHDYQLIQYDIVAGKQYSTKWAEQKIK